MIRGDCICDLALYTFSTSCVKMVCVAVVAGFAVIFYILPKRATLQISHT